MHLRLAEPMRQVAPAGANIWKRYCWSSLVISDRLALLAMTSQHEIPPLVDFSSMNLGVIQRLVCQLVSVLGRHSQLCHSCIYAQECYNHKGLLGSKARNPQRRCERRCELWCMLCRGMRSSDARGFLAHTYCRLRGRGARDVCACCGRVVYLDGNIDPSVWD